MLGGSVSLEVWFLSFWLGWKRRETGVTWFQKMYLSSRGLVFSLLFIFSSYFYFVTKLKKEEGVGGAEKTEGANEQNFLPFRHVLLHRPALSISQESLTLVLLLLFYLFILVYLTLNIFCVRMIGGLQQIKYLPLDCIYFLI